MHSKYSQVCFFPEFSQILPGLLFPWRLQYHVCICIWGNEEPKKHTSLISKVSKNEQKKKKQKMMGKKPSQNIKKSPQFNL